MSDLAIDRVFLDYSASKLVELSARIPSCLDRLTEDQIWARRQESENAIGNLVLHLCGNVRQWIVTQIVGGSDTRDRDREFSTRGGLTKAELLERLHVTMQDAVAAIRAVSPRQLLERRKIQGYDVTVLEAIYHVVEHFSMHTGQIIFATKMLTSADLGFYEHLNSPREHAAR